jgi:hypothetical protein
MFNKRIMLPMHMPFKITAAILQFIETLNLKEILIKRFNVCIDKILHVNI